MEKRTGKFAGDDPFVIAREWLAQAQESEINDPNAIALSTVDADGLPNVRMVLLKGVDADSFVFYTNYESAKACDARSACVGAWRAKTDLRPMNTISRGHSKVALALGHRSSRARSAVAAR